MDDQHNVGTKLCHQVKDNKIDDNHHQTVHTMVKETSYENDFDEIVVNTTETRSRVRCNAVPTSTVQRKRARRAP